MSDPQVSVRVAAGYIPVSAELLADPQPQWPPTPEQLAAAAEARAAAVQSRSEHQQRLVEAASGLAAEILELHAPDDRGCCKGCDVEGMEAEPPEWPCRTVAVVAGHLGVLR